MLNHSVVIGWGLGSLGLAVILNTFNVLLVAYLTLVVGIEPALAGSIIMFVKIYDVLTDLPMGWLTDRTRTRWGARRPYMFAAGLLTPVALVMLFSAPQGDTVSWVAAALVLYATGYTLFNVPYLSMPAELSPDTHLRTRMVAWRSRFIAAGTFFGIAFAPYFIGAMGRGQDAYASLGQIMAATVAFAFIACSIMTRTAKPVDAQTAIPIAAQLKTIFANHHFRTLLWIKVTHLLALAVGAGSLFFFFRFALDRDPQALGIYGAVTASVWALTMPLWTRIARFRGKRYGYFVATLAYTVLTLSWLLSGPDESFAVLLLRGAAFGVISGGMLLMGNAMLQDVMDHDYRRTGDRKNGMFAGSYSLVEKLTSGIGAQILGIVLSVSGFDRAMPEQTGTAIQGIYVAVALIPTVLMLVSLFVIRAYRLDESELTA